MQKEYLIYRRNYIRKPNKNASNIRKSQRRCRLYGHNAFEVLIAKYGLIDPSKYASPALSLVNAHDEFYRKAVCGKTARTV